MSYTENESILKELVGSTLKKIIENRILLLKNTFEKKNEEIEKYVRAELEPKMIDYFKKYPDILLYLVERVTWTIEYEFAGEQTKPFLEEMRNPDFDIAGSPGEQLRQYRTDGSIQVADPEVVFQNELSQSRATLVRISHNTPTTFREDTAEAFERRVLDFLRENSIKVGGEWQLPLARRTAELEKYYKTMPEDADDGLLRELAEVEKIVVQDREDRAKKEMTELVGQGTNTKFATRISSTKVERQDNKQKELHANTIQRWVDQLTRFIHEFDSPEKARQFSDELFFGKPST